MCSVLFGKIFIVTHTESFFSCSFASSDFCLQPKICWPAANTEASRCMREKSSGEYQCMVPYNSVSIFGFLSQSYWFCFLCFIFQCPNFMGVAWPFWQVRTRVHWYGFQNFIQNIVFAKYHWQLSRNLKREQRKLYPMSQIRCMRSAEISLSIFA